MYRSTVLFAVIIVLQLGACGYQYDSAGERKLLPNPLPSEFPYEITGQLHKIWAGNEFQVVVDNTVYYLILEGVNNPDSHDQHGQHALDQLREFLSQGPIRAVVNRRDEFERGIARVYVGDTDVNLEMILSGYAFYDGSVFEGSTAFAEAEKIAHRQQRGIWKELKR